MPIFVAREWFRHTIGFARNEVSRRYVDSTPEIWIPRVDSLRERDPKLKQGSKPTAVDGADELLTEMEAHCATSVRLYESLLERKVAPEIARSVLPQGMYTEFIETGSLAAYARLWALRTDSGAQAEIREYAHAVEALLLPYFPIAWRELTKNDSV